MSDWEITIPLLVFTRIKQEFSQTIKNTYNMTDKNFSTVGSSDTPAVFPFVRFEILPANEEGEDLEGNSVNAGTFGFQIDVYSNKTQNETRKILSEIKRIAKQMKFQINQFPTFEDTKDYHRGTIRIKRLIGASDKI